MCQTRENRESKSASRKDLNSQYVALLYSCGRIPQSTSKNHHPWLKARLADIVWLQNRKLGPSFPLLAIDAYRAIPLDTEVCREGQECWARAIALACTLGKAASKQIEEIESAICEALVAAKATDGYLAFWLADMLKKFHMGKSQGSTIALKLEALARDFDQEGDLHRAKDYLITHNFQPILKAYTA